MNYNKIYNNLIESRLKFDREKNKDGLLELHHIIPKSLGGSEELTNLVLLTPREHYIAHWLLYKIHTGKDKSKMAYAFFRMCSNNPNQKRTISSKDFERAKFSMSLSCSGENNPNFGKKLWNTEQRKEISKRQQGKGNSMYGKTPWNKGKQIGKLSKERKQHLSNVLSGRKIKESTKQKISEALTGKPKSLEHKEQLSKSLKGRPRNIESARKTGESLKGRKHEIVTCPHCGKVGGENSYDEMALFKL